MSFSTLESILLYIKDIPVKRSPINAAIVCAEFVKYLSCF